MKIVLVVAVAENNVIGRNGQLPWRLKSDLKHFRALTIGKPVIMGRKTYQSLGKPLAGRDNIVVTRDRNFAAASTGVAVVVDGVSAALDLGCRLAAEHGVDEVMVIGGAEIYRAALPWADRIYLTRVHASPDGDAMFDADAAVAGWTEVAAEACPPGPRDDYRASFLIFDRNSMA